MAQAEVPFNPIPTVSPTGDGTDVRSTVGAFGGAAAMGLGNIGDSLIKAGDEIQRTKLARASLIGDLTANDASTGFMQSVTKAYGEYSALEGPAAVGGLNKFKTTLDDLYKKSIAALPNLATKARASTSFKYIADTYYRYAQSYSTAQLKDWQTASHTARAEELGNQAILGINNPDVMATALNASDHEVEKLWESKGWDQDTINNEVKKNRGKNIQNVVISMLDGGDVRGATAMFHLHQDEIDSGSTISILNKLRPQLLAQRAAEGVNTIIGKGIIAPNILRAQIHQESGGDISAISPKGALGAMQLMPETARMVADEMGLPFDKQRLLTDKAYNMALGTHYMEGLLKQFHGNYAMALAGYNAGPGRVGEWVRRFGDPSKGEISEQAWIDSIPFDETKNYVNAIMAGAGGAPDAPMGSDQLPDRSQALQDVFAMTEDNPALRTAMVGQLNQQYTLATAIRADQTAQAKAVQDAQKAASDAAQNEVISDALSPAPKITVQAVANDPRYAGDPAGRLRMVNWLEARSKPGPASEVSRTTLASLLTRLRAPDGDPTKIVDMAAAMEAQNQGKLSNADFNAFHTEFQAMRTPDGKELGETKGEFFKRYDAMIMKTDPTKGLADPLSPGRAFEFHQMVDAKVAAYKKAGKDWQSLFDPSSSEFLGSAKVLDHFMPSMDQLMREQQDRQRNDQAVQAAKLRAENAIIEQEPFLPTAPTINEKGLVSQPSIKEDKAGYVAPGDVVPAPAPEAALTRGLSDDNINTMTEKYNQMLVKGGGDPAIIRELTDQYRASLKKTPVITVPVMRPGEAPGDYLRRTGASGMLMPHEFRGLDLGSKLTMLEKLIG